MRALRRAAPVCQPCEPAADDGDELPRPLLKTIEGMMDELQRNDIEAATRVVLSSSDVLMQYNLTTAFGLLRASAPDDDTAEACDLAFEFMMSCLEPMSELAKALMNRHRETLNKLVEAARMRRGGMAELERTMCELRPRLDGSFLSYLQREVTRLREAAEVRRSIPEEVFLTWPPEKREASRNADTLLKFMELVQQRVLSELDWNIEGEEGVVARLLAIASPDQRAQELRMGLAELPDAQARAAFVAACDRIATELQAKRDDKELSEEERPNAALCEDASNLYALANRLVEQADPPAAPRAR